MATLFAPMSDLGQAAPLPEGVVEEEDAEVVAEEAPDAEDGLVEQADGSYLVPEPKSKTTSKGEFDDNLVETGLISSEEANALGSDLAELIELDKEARTDRDKQYAEGIKRTGLTRSKVGANFDGASAVTHPMLAKGCVDFASKAIKELFPANGPVRTQIIGEQTDVKLERAERKKAYMNWQLTEQIPEHRPEFEKMLSQLPLGGSQYKRWWYDTKLARPRTQAVFIDDVFLPFDQSDFYSSPRVTHREFISPEEFEARIASGLYVDPEGSLQGEQPERSQAGEAAREVEGVTDDSAYDATGGAREVFTVYVCLELDADPLVPADTGVCPYVLHVDKHTKKTLAAYRNWDAEDSLHRALPWMVEYTFIPWRGAYGVGLAHLIGGLAVSSTGALNALLDAAHIANFPGAIKMRGGRTAGQSVTVNAGEIAEIDAPPGVDDIRKLVMPFPYNGPSAVLYNLLEWLTAQAEVVVSTASEKIADAGANMPMGTALALIEGGSVNFSAIHARLHHSLRKELEILHRLDKVHLTDAAVQEALGSAVAYRRDFTGAMDILPTSDPNIFSESQRYAQLQAVLQLASMPQFAGLFKMDRLLMRALRLLQVPYAEEVAHLPPDPQRMTAVQENAAASDPEGKVLKVYDNQNDLAHLTSHVTFMTSPLLGSSVLVGPIALPKLLAHCREHLVAYYRKNHIAATQALISVAERTGQAIDPAQAEQQGHAFADRALAAALAPLVAPGLEQAVQLAMQFAPKPPADGNVVAKLAADAQASKERIAAEAAAAAVKNAHEVALKDKELAQQAAQKQADRDVNRDAATMATAIEKMQVDSEAKLGRLTLIVEAQKTDAVEQNKRLLEEMRAEAAEKAAAAQAHTARMADEFKAQNAIALQVIKQLLAERLPEPGVGPDGKPLPAKPAPDTSELLKPLIEAVVASSTQAARAVEGLSLGMTKLQELTAAPRTAKYLRGPNGETLGVQSYIGGQ